MKVESTLNVLFGRGDPGCEWSQFQEANNDRWKSLRDILLPVPGETTGTSEQELLCWRHIKGVEHPALKGRECVRPLC